MRKVILAGTLLVSSFAFGAEPLSVNVGTRITIDASTSAVTACSLAKKNAENKAISDCASLNGVNRGFLDKVLTVARPPDSSDYCAVTVKLNCELSL